MTNISRMKWNLSIDVLKVAENFSLAISWKIIFQMMPEFFTLLFSAIVIAKWNYYYWLDWMFWIYCIKVLQPYEVTHPCNLDWIACIIFHSVGRVFFNRVINCSSTKFIAIIVNVCVFFMQIFRLTILTFRVTSTPLTFCVSRDLKFSQSQFQAAEFNWRQFNTKSNEKCAKTGAIFYFKS